MKLNISNKELISILGIALCVGNSIVMFTTFLFAFFNGGHFAIQINLYGEAIFELILIPCTIITGVYGLITYVKIIKRR